MNWDSTVCERWLLGALEKMNGLSWQGASSTLPKDGALGKSTARVPSRVDGGLWVPHMCRDTVGLSVFFWEISVAC